MLMRFVATVNLNGARTQWQQNGVNLKIEKQNTQQKLTYLYVYKYLQVGKEDITFNLAQHGKVNEQMYMNECLHAVNADDMGFL